MKDEKTDCVSWCAVAKACRFLIALAMAAMLAGCIFAPPKFGSRGYVFPGEEQYERYLQWCVKESAEVAKCCKSWGKPDIIKIGSSGGLLAWDSRQTTLKVGSFG